MRFTDIGLLCLCAAMPVMAAIGQPVKVTGGLVSGVPGKNAAVTVFKGIPFAAPPVGDLRWRAPRPAVPWQGVRKADRFSASCIQSIVKERGQWTYEFMTHTEVSEDCLYLNIWTPAKSPGDKLPVFVYIYGGGFVEGSGAVPVYDGEGLAGKGLVMITINYRVGAFGYLAHPELTKESGHNASGNYGPQDQVAALRWVRDNIAAFGGDPARVTIAGQSAGSISVHDLIASPLAKGLFRGGIAQSGNTGVGRSGGGPMVPHRSLAEAEAAGVKWAEAKGAHSLAELRAMSWQTVTASVPAAGGGRGAPAGPAFGPIVDGYFLPMTEPDAFAKGRQNDVPVLTGANAGELRGVMAPPPGQSVTLDAFRQQARQQYGAVADQFLALYPASNDQEAAAARSESARDSALSGMYLWAAQRARTSKTKAFVYLWDHPIPGPNSERLGAFHTAEVPYVLNTLYMSDRPFTDTDRKVADMMSSYWANFAKTGDPNGKGLPQWAPIGDTPQIWEVGDKNAQVPAASTPARFAFFAKFLPGS